MQIPTSTLLNDYLIHTRDNSPENIARGKERMDHYYTLLLTESNNFVIERTKYSKLKADQRAFLLPPDYIKMKRVRVRIGGIWYRVDPVLNLDRWADETSQEITTSIPINYTLINEQGRMHIELTDIPNADSNVVNFEIIYEGTQDPLYFPTDIVNGTASFVQGNPDVAGVDTTWTEDIIGRFIKVTNGKSWYEIASVGSILSLSLVNYFQEVNVSSANYIIAEVPRLPHEYHRTPLWGAVAEYYKPNNANKSADYEKWYARDVILIQNKYQNKTKGSVTPGVRIGSRVSGVPRNYPRAPLRRI